MKNFARIIDLGEAECCLHRRGTIELAFDFWLRRDGQILSHTAYKDYLHSGFLDVLFGGGYEDQLRDECKRVLAAVEHYADLNEENLQENVPMTLDRQSLDMLYSPNAD